MWRMPLLILLLVLTLVVALLLVLARRPNEAKTAADRAGDEAAAAKSTGLSIDDRVAGQVPAKRIEPLDVLAVSVRGTLLDRPINNRFLVEPGGGVSLGAPYGRVQVKGLTLPEAAIAIKKQLEEVLAAPEVEVLDAGHATQWWAGPPKSPYRIRPNDLLWIDVCGTLLDAPIYGEYTVDPDGNIPFGPAYGSVALKGLSLEEAEQAIVRKLEEVLQRPEAAVTLAGWKTDRL